MLLRAAGCAGRFAKALCTSPRFWIIIAVTTLVLIGEERSASPLSGQVPAHYVGDVNIHSLANFSRSRAAEQRSTVAALGSIGEPASVDYLIAVLSARKNFERREEIRAGWSRELAQQARARGMSLQVVFIVGDMGDGGSNAEGKDFRHSASGSDSPVSPSGAVSVSSLGEEELDAHMMKEHLHNDDMFVVCCGVVDVYDNSANKMVGFYRTLFKIGLKYRGVVKMDDDTVLFPERLLAVLDVNTSPCWFSALPPGQRECNKEEQGGGLIPSVGSVLRDAKTEGGAMLWWGNFRISENVGRSPELKWKVDHSKYRRDFFPTYASGPIHVMSEPLTRWFGSHAKELDTSVWCARTQT